MTILICLCLLLYLACTLAPLPTTRRGYGIQLNATKDDRLLYCNGRLVLLRSLANPSDTLIFSEHKANVNVAVASPSGYWIASGDEEGNVLIWSYPQLVVKYSYKVAKTINDIDWDESSTRLVCAGDGANKAKVISWDSGNTLGEITMHNLPIISVSYRKHRPYRIASGSEDLSVNFYEGPPFKYKDSYKGHSRYPNAVRYSGNGELLVSVGADSKIVFYDAKDHTIKLEINDSQILHKGAIYAVSWSPDHEYIITASADKTCKIWKVSDGSCQTTFTVGNTTDDMQVGVIWTAKYLISVSLSGAINYLDKDHPDSIKQVLHGHQSSLQSIVCDNKANRFYTAGLTGEITEWQFNAPNHVTGSWLTGKGHGGKVVSALTLGESGRILYSFGLDDKLRINDLAAHSLNSEGYELGGLPIAAVTTHTDKTVNIVILAQEKVIIIKDGSILSSLSLGYVPTALAISSDDKYVIIGGKDKKLHLYTYDCQTHKLLAASNNNDSVITVHDKPITAIQISSDNEFIVSADKEASLYIHKRNHDNDISLASGYTLMNKSGWRFHQAAIQSLSIHPSNKSIITASLDYSLILWKDLETYDSSSRIKITAAHSASVDAVKWWDENTIISYSADKTIKIWTI